MPKIVNLDTAFATLHKGITEKNERDVTAGGLAVLESIAYDLRRIADSVDKVGRGKPGKPLT